MNNDDDNYMGVLLDEIRDQNKAVLEAVGDIQLNTAYFQEMRTDISELKSDMKIVKAAITDISKQQNDHDHLITQLEAAA